MKGKNRQLEEFRDYAHLRLHILSTHFSGLYLMNLDMATIAKELGWDDSVRSVEFMLGDLIKKAKEENRQSDLYECFASLITKRVNEYEHYLSLYPQAHAILSQWIGKANRTQEYIKGLLEEKL